MRIIPILPIVGRLLLGFALMTCVPVAFALASGEVRTALAFGLTGLFALFVGGAIVLAQPMQKSLDVVTYGLPVLVAVWFLLPACAAVPFLLDRSLTSFAAAVFEATSGMTTTGATVFPTLAGVPRGILVWRAELQWVGGLVTLIGISVLLAPARRALQPNYGTINIEHMARQGAWMPRALFRTILPLYCGLTALCFIGLSASGVPPFDAFCLALSAISTGGFMPRDGTIAHYGSISATAILLLTMLAGAVSLVWLRAVASFRVSLLWENTEPLWIFALVGAVGIFIGIELFAAPSVTGGLHFALSSMIQGLATAASLITTTGFSISEDAHTMLPYIVVLFLVFLGGGRFSTAGGLKFFRLSAMSRQCFAELDHLIYPNSAAAIASEESAERNDLIGSIWTYFAVGGVVVAIAALMVSLDDVEPPAALLAAVAAMSNAGPAYGLPTAPGFDPTLTYAEMSDRSLIALSLTMILGRFEILALLTLFNVSYWRG